MSDPHAGQTFEYGDEEMLVNDDLNVQEIDDHSWQ